jgi:hypothetical protein
MKKPAVLLGVALLLAAMAFAQLPISTGEPTLTFKVIPIESTAPSAEHKVTPYRLFDRMVVTVWDPVACGQQAINPKFSISDNKLLLSYSLTAAVQGAKQCSLVSEFDISNAPHLDMEVHFAGGPEPYVIAKLKKCPDYQPKGSDIYECLAPAK